MENEETSLAAMFAQLPKVTKHITDVQDCVVKILLHLPAKSLLTSQTVCKGWSKMIQERRFKKLHFEHIDWKGETSQLLLLKDTHDDYIIHVEAMVLDEDLQLSNILMPQDLAGDRVFLGSCNGLLLIGVEGEFTVFNPATREVVSLPRPTNIKGYGTKVTEGMYAELVFHRATGEYKVILFYWSYPVYILGAFLVYTLGANSSWRFISEAEDLPTGSGVNLDDTVYWPYEYFINGAPNSFIISFDLNTEQIGKIDLLEQDARNLAGLTTWDGKLCVASFIKEHRRLEMSTFDNSKWTPRHVIQLPEIEGNFRLLTPYSFKSDRVFIWTSERTYYHEISGNPNNIQETPGAAFS